MSQPDLPAVEPSAVSPDACVIDVREPDEWVAGHARGSRNVPLGDLVVRLAEVPGDHEVIVVCRSGERSSRATAYLNVAGRRAVVLDGGMQAWAAQGLPMESSTGAPPRVR